MHGQAWPELWKARKGSAFGGEQPWMGAEGGVQQKRTQNEKMIKKNQNFLKELRLK